MSRILTTDQALIDRLGLDDTDAFEELYRQYWHSLYLYSYRKLQSRTDAKKIVSSIFIELWEKRRSLPVTFSLPQHLYAEVRRLVVKSLSEKLADNSDHTCLEKRFSNEFSVQSLLAARKPISGQYTVINKPSELMRQHAGQTGIGAQTTISTVKWLLQSFTNKLSLINLLSYPKN